MRHDDPIVIAFKKELAILVERYKIKVWSKDNYDGEERYCGESHYLEFDDDLYAAEEIHEVFKNLNPPVRL